MRSNIFQEETQKFQEEIQHFQEETQKIQVGIQEILGIQKYYFSSKFEEKTLKIWYFCHLQISSSSLCFRVFANG